MHSSKKQIHLEFGESKYNLNEASLNKAIR